MQVRQKLTEFGLNEVFKKLNGAPFTVTYQNGVTKHYGDGGPKFMIRFNDDDIVNLLTGDMFTKFGEAYMNGRIDFEGDLADLVSLALGNNLMSITQAENGFARNMPSRPVDKNFTYEKKNIAHHYDLGNDFFRLWLDETMTYSCAYFRSASDTLEQAADARKSGIH